MRSVAVINQKGGVGKTTTVANLSAALAARGQKVLAIDLDPQAHLTIHLGREPGADGPSIYEVLTDSTPLDEAIVPVGDNLRLVPAHIDLAAAEMELVSVVGREVILRDALENLQTPYDFIFVDCPPSLGVLTVNALAAAGEVFIPLQPHFLALQGLGKLLETVDLVAKRINTDLKVTGVILCLYGAGTKLAGEVVEDVRSFLAQSREMDCAWSGARLFETAIRRNIRLAEAPSHGLTIFEYDPRSHGASDYSRLAGELLGNERRASQPAAAVASPIASLKALTVQGDSDPQSQTPRSDTLPDSGRPPSDDGEDRSTDPPVRPAVTTPDPGGAADVAGIA